MVLPVSRFVRERPGEDLLLPLADAAARGCRIVSVCMATFVVAAAGLLDKRRATTHWLIAQQVVLAQRMLETTRLSVAEIGRQCGFQDVSVFRRHFTARTGLSPVSYRHAFGQLDGQATRQ